MSSQPPETFKPLEKPINGETPLPSAALPSETSALNDALRMTQENMAALQKMQEQTAALHQQFLQGQETAQRTLQSLVEQQQRLVEQRLGLAPSPLPRAEPARTPVQAPVRIAAPPVVAAPTAPRPAETPRAASPGAGSRAPGATADTATPSSIDADKVEVVLLEVVADKTGYPADILNLDMEMDSDLGIDSIKRVEILSTLQQRIPEAPPVGPEHLGTLRTLRQIVAFLTDDDSDAPSAAVVEVAEIATDVKKNGRAPASISTVDHEIGSSVLAVVSTKTGFPVDALNMNMDLTSDLGIDRVKRAEIVSLLRDKTPLMPEISHGTINSWRTLRNVVDTLAEATKAYAKPSSIDADELMRAGRSRAQAPQRSVLTVAALDETADRKKISLASDGVVWISRDDSGLSAQIADRLEGLGLKPRLVALEDAASLEPPSKLAGLVVVGPANPDSDAFLAQSLTLLSRATPALRRSGRGEGSVFVTISRLEGFFGLKGMGPETQPASGGLAGLSKTASLEWPEVHCKAMDVTMALEGVDVDAVVDEIFCEGPLEVGLTATGRVTLELSPSAIIPADASLELDKDDVIVLSGGARGVTAAVARELAQTFGSKLVLLGRSPEPTDEPDWLRGKSAEADIKKEIVARAASGASPKHVGEEYARLMANREIRQTLNDLARVAHVEYHAVDVRDGAAVQSLLADVRAKLGPITGLVHGAGVLADQLIEDKTAEQFSRVFGTKVAGMTALVDAVPVDALKVVVLFSSSTARFGRKGQVDYAVANEVLNKAAWQLAAKIPAARVVSVGFGPWDGGMVTPSLAKVFRREGVGLIDLKEGSRALIDEIRHGSRDAVEVVMIARPDKMDKMDGAEPSASWNGNLSVAFEKDIGVEQVPILKDHVLNGRAVVPMALMVEWLAHAAVHKNPGLRFHGFDDLRVLKGLTLDAGETRTTQVLTGKATKENGHGIFSVPVEIRSTSADGKVHHHARTTIHLASTLPKASGALLNIDTSPYDRPSDEIYRDLLFHGPLLQGIQKVEGISPDAIVARVGPTAPPPRWIVEPLRSAWLADPLALDVAFQLMIVWSREIHGAASLPASAGRYRQFRNSFPEEGVSVVIKIRENGNRLARADIEFLDGKGGLVARLEDYECVLDTSLSEAFTRNRLPV